MQSQKHHSTKNKVLNDESNNQTNKQLLHVYNILPKRNRKNNFFFIKTQTPESALQRSVHKSYWEDPRMHNARSAIPIFQTIYSYAQASALAR